MMEKKILVTGGSGFIGSNFIRHTLQNQPGFQIFNLDALTYAGNPLNLENMPEDQQARYHFIKGDICDAPLLTKPVCAADI